MAISGTSSTQRRGNQRFSSRWITPISVILAIIYTFSHCVLLYYHSQAQVLLYPVSGKKEFKERIKTLYVRTNNNNSNIKHKNTTREPKTKTVHKNVTEKISNDDKHTDDSSSSLLGPHPHRGARDAKGKWGYVADVYAVRRRMEELRKASPPPPPSSYNLSLGTIDDNIDRYLPLTDKELEESVCGRPIGTGYEFNAWPLLVDKVVVGASDPTLPAVSERNVNEIYDETKAQLKRVGSPPRILCVIYTISSNHHRVRAIADTWGHRCDGFLAASNETVPEIGAVNIPHMGDEIYGNMWQKTRSIWAYIHDNFLHDFDFFHLGGDDMHIIVENMRHYLWGMMGKQQQQQQQPLYLGLRIPQQKLKKVKKIKYYMSGGPGYTVNRHTLKLFVKNALSSCETNTTTHAEDRLFSDCLRDTMGIIGNDTTDARNEQRYCYIPPVMAFDGPGGNKTYNAMVYNYWTRLHGGLKWKIGMEAISSQAIVMHWFRQVEQLKRHHANLYRSCPRGTVLADHPPATMEEAFDSRYGLKYWLRYPNRSSN